MYMQRGDGAATCPGSKKYLSYVALCSTVIVFYVLLRICQVSPSYCHCACPVHTHTHTLRHLALHMRRRFATFSAICAVFHVHVHVHVQDMKIFHSAHFFSPYSRVYTSYTRVCVSVCMLHIQVGKLCTYIIIMKMVLT